MTFQHYLLLTGIEVQQFQAPVIAGCQNAAIVRTYLNAVYRCRMRLEAVQFFSVNGVPDFDRLIYASRISLEVGLIAAVVSVAVGTLLGVMAGFWGGWVDLVIMRFTDAMLAFPFLLFVILVVSVLKPSVTIIFVVIGLLGWAKAARVARGQTLSIMQNNFIDASRVVGASSWRIIFHHIIPNIMGPLIVLTTLQVGNYILTEGALSYIGAGVPQPIPSWGSMIYTGQQYYQTAPWLMLYPGLMLTLTVIGFNLVGDGLDAALNPRN